MNQHIFAFHKHHILFTTSFTFCGLWPNYFKKTFQLPYIAQYLFSLYVHYFRHYTACCVERHDNVLLPPWQAVGEVYSWTPWISATQGVLRLCRVPFVSPSDHQVQSVRKALFSWSFIQQTVHRTILYIEGHCLFWRNMAMLLPSSFRAIGNVFRHACVFVNTTTVQCWFFACSCVCL